MKCRALLNMAKRNKEKDNCGLLMAFSVLLPIVCKMSELSDE